MQTHGITARLATPGPLLIISICLLAVHPLLWLAAAGPQALQYLGSWLAFVVLVLTAWSFLGEEQPESEFGCRYAGLLLALGAVLGLAVRALRLRPLSRVAPKIDAYALTTLAGAHRCGSAHSPTWLALTVGLSIFLDRVVQRLFAYGVHKL